MYAHGNFVQSYFYKAFHILFVLSLLVSSATVYSRKKCPDCTHHHHEACCKQNITFIWTLLIDVQLRAIFSASSTFMPKVSFNDHLILHPRTPPSLTVLSKLLYLTWPKYFIAFPLYTAHTSVLHEHLSAAKPPTVDFQSGMLEL